MAARPSGVVDSVFSYLQDGLAAGVWKAGDKLPSEKELCQKLQVSRMSVRSAIGKLVALGVVESYQGKGSYVRMPPRQDPLSDIGPLIVPAHADRLSVFEFRKVVEGESAALAAIRATEEMARDMEQTIRAMEEGRSNDDIARQDLAFHFLVAKATGNEVIIRMFEILQDTYLTMFEENVSTLGKMGAAYHRRILMAIRTRDMQTARQCMLEHLDATMRGMTK